LLTVGSSMWLGPEVALGPPYVMNAAAMMLAATV